MSEVIELRPAHGTRQEVRSHGGSFVCIKTTTVTGEDGKPERLKAGSTFVHDPRHWLVRTYPHLFAPAGPTRTRAKAAPRRPTAARTASPTAPAKRPTWKPLVRLDTRAAPTFTAQLSDKAYLAITDQAFGQRGEIETGGALFGIPAAKDAPLKIRRAGEPGPKARASRSSLLPDLEHTRREAAEIERSGGLDRWVGSWHTHPGTNGQPSDGDLRFFAWDCREWHLFGRSMDNYVGLILTPTWDQNRQSCESYLSWAKPTITAWHMRAVSEDQFICTCAEVVRC